MPATTKKPSKPISKRDASAKKETPTQAGGNPTKRIYVYKLALNRNEYGPGTIALPETALILAAKENAVGILCIYAEVDPSERKVDRQLLVLHSGMPIDRKDKLYYLDTVIRGELAHHVYIDKNVRLARGEGR